MAIYIASYDRAWPALFEAEARRLQGALGGLALHIDHVGSTAVPDLAAKPVIDIQVAVADPGDVEVCRGRLASLGYSHATFPLVFFHRPQEWPHTHHVHVRQDGSADEQRLILFRDWLRTHPADRLAYEALKRALASRADASTAEGRARYSEAKTEFVRQIEQRAFRSGRASRR